MINILHSSKHKFYSEENDMALFDAFSKKASEAGQTAIQKGKELSGTARVSFPNFLKCEH